MTVNEAIPKYLQKVKVAGNESTYKYYTQYFRFISEFIGDIEIESLSKYDVNDMLAAKRVKSPNISNATLNKFIQVTKTLYKYIN